MLALDDLDLQPHGASGRFHVSQRSLGVRGIARIDEHSHASGSRYQFTQKFQPFCRQLADEKIDARQVAARPGEAGDETKPDRVFGDAEDDRNRRGCCFGRERRSGPPLATMTRDLPANQVGRQLRQPIESALRPAVDDRNVLALDVAGFLQALAERVQTASDRVRAIGCRGTRSPASPAAARRAAKRPAAAAPPSSVMNSRRLV